jgi:tRNA pseudouridine55 synthase
MGGVTAAQIEEVAAGFVGDILQVPPMVSAVKIDGRRLHELAREGIEIDRPPRPVSIHSLEVSSIDEAHGTFRIRVTCSSGTYVRTLAADIGAALGGGAHLRDLRRTGIGSFDENEARPIDDAALLSPAEGLRDYPALAVSGEMATAVGHGKVLGRSSLGFEGTGPWRILDDSGALLAMYETHGDDRAKPAVVLVG